MTTTTAPPAERRTPCPDWCAHTETYDPASVEVPGAMWHQGAVTVVSTAEHSGVSARLELFEHPVFRDEYPHRYNVENLRRPRRSDRARPRAR